MNLKKSELRYILNINLQNTIFNQITRIYGIYDLQNRRAELLKNT